MEIQGFELTGRDRVYAWDKVEGANGFRRVNLFPAEDIDAVSTPTLRRRMNEQLSAAKPEVVAIPGWFDRGAIVALHWCLGNRIPVVIMSESTGHDWQRAGWKERIKLAVVKACSTGLVGGEPHSDYLASLGMPKNRIFKGYDAVDNDHFAQGAHAVRSNWQEVRRELDLPENFFLASARFVKKKNLSRLIQAYARYRELANSSSTCDSLARTNPWNLVILGDGPLRPALIAQISALDLREHVHLPGFKQYEELPMYYGLASVFVHASTVEQWGLVVNEAMASGLPVLVSNRCGCAPDLVQEGRNGFNFDPYNIESLAHLMLKISARNFPLSEFGSASRDIVADWGPERFAAGFEQAVETALRVPRPAPTMLDRLLLRLLLLR